LANPPSYDGFSDRTGDCVTVPQPPAISTIREMKENLIEIIQKCLCEVDRANRH